MGLTYNAYDSVIQDLRYYAMDKRRSKEYREILATAASALEAANLELKEAQRIIKRFNDSLSAAIETFQEVKNYTEDQDD